MRAIDKFMKEQARNHSVNWTNVLTGNSRTTVDPSQYGVRVSTFRKQANAEGFKTTMWGPDEVQIYR